MPCVLLIMKLVGHIWVWDEIQGLINEWPMMPPMQHPPGILAATLHQHFISPSILTLDQQMNHAPVITQVPPFTLNGFHPATNNQMAVYPLQNSSLMNTASAGAGLPIPVELSAVVPDISQRLGVKAWKQVIRDWEYPDPNQMHHTALKDWKHEWHASSRQSQLWGQCWTITLEFIVE